MFIVFCRDNRKFREGEFIKRDGKKSDLTWDDIPRDVKISQIQLTYPFRVNFKKTDGTHDRSVAPLLTVGPYNRYYFSNEATVRMMVVGTQQIQTGEARLEAKIVGGIDDNLKLVIEVRMDKMGNCNISRFPLKTLEDRIKNGTFRADIIRNGSY